MPLDFYVQDMSGYGQLLLSGARLGFVVDAGFQDQYGSITLDAQAAGDIFSGPLPVDIGANFKNGIELRVGRGLYPGPSMLDAYYPASKLQGGYKTNDVKMSVLYIPSTILSCPLVTLSEGLDNAWMFNAQVGNNTLWGLNFGLTTAMQVNRRVSEVLAGINVKVGSVSTVGAQLIQRSFGVRGLPGSVYGLKFNRALTSCVTGELSWGIEDNRIKVGTGLKMNVYDTCKIKVRAALVEQQRAFVSQLGFGLEFSLINYVRKLNR